MSRYWSRRQANAMAALERREKRLKKRLNAFYEAESRRLADGIFAFYNRYGDQMKTLDGDVMYNWYGHLMRSMDPDARQMLFEDWDGFVQMFPEYRDLAPLRENLSRLNRLEGLQMSVQLQLDALAGKVNDAVTGHLTDVAEDALKSICRDMGHEYNPEMVRNFVNTAWADSESFSKRIWDNTQKLAGYLTTDISHGLARGDSYKQLTQNLTERFEKVSRRDAYRLIYTEGTFAYNQATLSVVKEDFDFYKISTVGDGKVCEICRGFNDKIFRMEDAEAGVNFPPFHPWCRCSFEVVVPDREQWLRDYERKHGRDGSAVLNRV